MPPMLAAIFCACWRTIFRSVPTIRTAIGVGEPKLMTEDTMSPGSRLKVASPDRCCATARVNPPCSSRRASQGITFLGRTSRSFSRNASSLIPLASVSATRTWPSSGPRMKSTMLSMPKLGGTWPTKPIVIRTCPGPASRSISWRHLIAISRVSS